ncbi:MAG: hypothetical protein Q8R76_12815 [Candidatus Omnitrophota bacterium]|nr:hypothetical protein [Candidatus Omnitrophota bacterium]
MMTSEKEQLSPLGPDSASSDPLERLLREHLEEFVSGNRAARVVAQGLHVIGVGFRPLLDHLAFRTLDSEERAREFETYGYMFDASLGVLEYDSWQTKVYRRTGYPALLFDQPLEGDKGKASLIPEWVSTFGDKTLHHAAILVDNINEAVFYLEKQGVPFSGKVVGQGGSNLRQTFSMPEIKDGKVFSVLELVERHEGYTGFLPHQAAGIMEEARTK